LTKAVLVADLDDTLVDTRILDPLRRQRRWKECVARLDVALAFPRIADTLRAIRKEGVAIAIVTNSVSYYASAVLRHFQLEYDTLVAWHDTRLHKPDPAPVRAALARINPSQGSPLLGLGDSSDDCAAYRAAGLRTLGAGWSATFVRDVAWDSVLRNPLDLKSAVS
jgi:phosphoglycolate phosphatase-like HAD superfamily hydrolase